MRVEESFSQTRSHRTREVLRVLWITLVLNWIVAALKIVFGMITRSMVLVADGVHSFSDGTSNVVGLVAVYVSGHPADEDHPYGHSKYETFASLVIAFMLFAAAFGILREAIGGFFRERAPIVNLWSFVVTGGTLAINVFVAWYERRMGKKLKSEFLLNDSWHTLSDIFVTLTVMMALAGILMGVRWLDSLFALGIGTLIVAVAVGILKRSSDVLCDKAVLDTQSVERVVRGVPGVRDCHEVRTRGRFDEVYVDLHALVDNEMTVRQAHDLSNVIEKTLKRDFPVICDVVIHIEPVTHEH